MLAASKRSARQGASEVALSSGFPSDTAGPAIIDRATYCGLVSGRSYRWSPLRRSDSRNAAERNPANDCEHRQAETSVDYSTDDESRRSGNRQRRERLVPDVLAHIRCRVFG